VDQAAEGNLIVVMAAGPCTFEAIARHSMIDVTALHMLTTVASDCRNVWVSAGGSKPKLAAADEMQESCKAGDMEALLTQHACMAFHSTTQQRKSSGPHICTHHPTSLQLRTVTMAWQVAMLPFGPSPTFITRTAPRALCPGQGRSFCASLWRGLCCHFLEISPNPTMDPRLVQVSGDTITQQVKDARGVISRRIRQDREHYWCKLLIHCTIEHACTA
jgi:hypothetical protein